MPSRPSHRHVHPLARPAVRVTLVVVAVHAAWIAAYLLGGQEARDFARLGAGPVRFGVYQAERAGERPPVTYDPKYDYPSNADAPEGTGYDGQFAYYIAVSPTAGRYYADYPGYRYSRILYPLAARALAAGDPDLIPFSLILVNWLAVGAGTFALAGWLARRGCSPWWAMLYGFYPGLLTGLQRDLTEPLAYGLVACAIYLLDHGGRHRVLWAGAAFGLAGLTRQSTVVFAAIYIVSILLAGGAGPLLDRVRGNLGRALPLAALALVPLAAWTVFVTAVIGPIETDYLEPLPMLGLVESRPWELDRQGPVIAGIVIPGLLLGGLGVRALRRNPGSPELHALLANLLLFVLMLGAIVYSGGYSAVGRNATGVVLAAVLALPVLSPWVPRSKVLRASLVALALFMFPVLVLYEFTRLDGG